MSIYWNTLMRRRLTRRRALAVTGGVMSATAISAACGGFSSDGDEDVSGILAPIRDESGDAKRGGVFKSRAQNEPSSWDPQLVGNTTQTTPFQYSALLRLKEGDLERTAGELDGDVPQSWELSPDRLTLTLKVNSSAHFAPLPPTDGRSVDARDVVFSWERMSSISQRRGEFAHSVSPDAPIVSVSASDDSTVVIKLARPNAAVTAQLASFEEDVNHAGGAVMPQGKYFVIALEEHYADAIVQAAAPQGDGGRPGRSPMSSVFQRLPDLDEVRLGEMDEAGIDVHVLSHVPSPVQQLNPESAVELAQGANNRLAEAITRHPDRFAGFAALPTPDPDAAAEELERCVTEMGFKGAMIHGRTQGAFHDDRRFYPIYERAQALDVPIYLHPGPPHPAVVEAYYQDFVSDYPWLTSAAWGYTIDTANQAMRMILSGLFSEFPELKIVLGHLGEGLPFLLDRMDEAFKREGSKPMEFKKTFCDHFYVTTSGFFSTPALLCTILQLGIDRVLFSVDWPFVENMPGMKWMETVPLSDEDKQKMFSGNARRLLKM